MGSSIFSFGMSEKGRLYISNLFYHYQICLIYISTTATCSCGVLVSRRTKGTKEVKLKSRRFNMSRHTRIERAATSQVRLRCCSCAKEMKAFEIVGDSN